MSQRWGIPKGNDLFSTIARGVGGLMDSAQDKIYGAIGETAHWCAGVCAAGLSKIGAVGMAAGVAAWGSRQLGEGSEREQAFDQLEPAAQKEMESLYASIGVEDCEPGQDVSAAATPSWDGNCRRSPDRPTDKEYAGMERSHANDQYLKGLSGNKSEEA